MSRSTWAPPHMAVGYQPACSSKQGLYPCYPIMPRFGLTGLGRGPGGGGGARGGAAGARGGAAGPVFVGAGPMQPKLGGRTFGRGFRFPSNFGPFFSDGSSAGVWNNWWPAWCSNYQYSYPFYSQPAVPQFGLGAVHAVNPVVPRYGMSGLGQLFSSDYSTWGAPEFMILGAAGLFLTYLLYAGTVQAKQTVYRGQAAGRKRRVAKAKKLREKAKQLEEGEGRLFGLI